MRLLKLLIILLLIVFPFGELLRFDLGNNIRFKPLDFIAGLIMIEWLRLLVTKKIRLPDKAWIYFVFPGVAFVSLITNSYWLTPLQMVVAGLYLFRWFSYMTIFFAVLRLSNNFKKKMLTMLVIDGLVIVILGFVQFFFFSSLKPLYSLGWDDHMYRMFSVFLDPNYTGGFFVLYLLFIGGLMCQVSQEKKLTTNQHVIAIPFHVSNKSMRILLTALIVITAIALFLTFSRSTILMFLVGVSVFFVLIGRKRLILGLVSFILIFTILISSQFYIENVNLFRVASTTSRIANYQDAFTIIQSDPVMGVGFNAYRYAKERHKITMNWIKNPSHADAGVDNSWLFVLATTGVVGFAAYLFLWFSIIKRAFVLGKKKENIFASLMFASAVGLFVHSFFMNSLFFPAIMVWLWIINGLMEQRSR